MLDYKFEQPTEQQMLSFLMVFASTGLPTEASSKASIPIKAVQYLLKTNPSFAASYAEAYLIYRDSIVREVHRRGVVGYEEPIIYKGEIMTRFDPATATEVPMTVRKYDSALLQMEAKRVEPGYLPAQIDPNQPNRVHIPGLHIPGLVEDSTGSKLVLQFVESKLEPEAVQVEDIEVAVDENSNEDVLGEDFS